MLTGVYEKLRSAGRPLTLELGEQHGVAERLAELQFEAQSLADDPTATEKQRAAASIALKLGSNPEQLLDLSGLDARGERADAFRDARDRLQRAALEELAARDRDLLQELLELFAAEYAAAKQRESALDFEDLQLCARELLLTDERVREAEQLRFRAIMVDEFQDTNRLQCDLVDVLRGGPGEKDVFFVGDEFQSIYGFRHADVDVFRERREQAALRLPLTQNYRSRPEVLAAVNVLFGEDFGGDYQPLAASGDFPDPVFGHPVELLVTDKRAYRDSPLSWRDGEARAIARRVHELVESRGGDAGRDRAALRRRHRRRALRAGAARARPADVSRDRPRLLRAAAGRRPARLPAADPQPLRRRGARRPCSRRRSSAPRTTRSCSCGGTPGAGRSTRASRSRFPKLSPTTTSG